MKKNLSKMFCLCVATTVFSIFVGCEEGSGVSSSNGLSEVSSSSADVINEAASSSSEDVVDYKMMSSSSVISSSDSEELVYCYNSSIKNESGSVFEIIDCTDGSKYLRDPALYNQYPESQKILPDGVQINAPLPGSDKAANCQRGPSVCYDIRVEEPYPHTEGGCIETIECPQRPSMVMELVFTRTCHCEGFSPWQSI